MELISPLYVNMIATAAMILGLALTIWWIIGFYRVRTREEEENLPKEQFEEDIQEVTGGIPTVIKVFLIFVFVTMICYVFYIWQGGISY
jgi:hypothetical protein